MDLTSLLFVSASRFEPADARASIKAIVLQSQRHNIRHDLTGAILFTGSYFAQVLEGHIAHLDKLISKIEGDNRHGDIVVVERSALSMRRFPNWSLIYLGRSQFIARHVVHVLRDCTPNERRNAAGRLTSLLYEFARSERRPARQQ